MYSLTNLRLVPITDKEGNYEPVRIDWKPRQPDAYAMYFICSTNLVSTFREIYSDQLVFEGNRSIVFNLDEEIQTDAVSHCVAMALTYHLDK